MPFRTLGTRVLIAACCLSLAQLCADPVRIDIDASWPARTDTTAATFTQWALLGDLSSTTANRSATHTFTGTSDGDLTFTVNQVAPAAADSTIYLNAGWLNKNGIAGGYKLSFDGVWVHQKTTTLDRPYASGGALELRISGLAAGIHTFTTYHNNIWGTTYGTMSKVVISVNGTQTAIATPSVQVTNDNDCAYAWFSATAVEGQPLVIRFDPDHSGDLDNVILNGFEIDRAAPPGAVAISPSPSDADEHVAGGLDTPTAGMEGTGKVTLSWTAAASAVSHDVYFGTDRSAVATATTASAALYKGRQTKISYDVSGLNSSDTYYWRVDEVNASGTVFPGSIWSFRVRHLAFPGAEGYGRFSRGGRGGRVIEVTNLLDYNTSAGEAAIPGSYRYAITQTGPRTIVFRVSGLIRLKGTCPIAKDNSYLTIAGQTAPGEGICLANYSDGIGGANDVTMRFIRDRVGDLCQDAMDGIGMGTSTDHSIVDHCTISWTMDEGTSSRDGHNITFQHNIVSEGLQHSYHYASADRTKYEEHAFAGSISGQIGSYHHNLLAHCTDRNWSLAGGLTQDSKYAGYLDIRNNVVYDWVGRTTDGGVMQCNYVNNYYKPYTKHKFVSWLLKLDAITPAWGSPLYYMTGNVMEGYDDGTQNWSTASFYNGATIAAQVKSDTPLFENYVTTHTAKEAYKLVLSDVGANQPASDVIDKRVINEVKTGTVTYIGTRSAYWPNSYTQPPPANYAGIIDTQTDVRDALGSPNFPWPAYATSNVPVDTDHDGMPDYWELAMGSDPNTDDHNADPDKDGYTLLEDYLAFLAAPHRVVLKGQTVDVDLSALAAGFSSPSYTVSGATKGSVALLTDGHTARFTATSSGTGLGGFSFTAKDSDGITLSSAVQVCVCASAPTYVDTTDTTPVGSLVNLSARGVSRSKDSPLIVGFVVSGSKDILVRAMGPSLSLFSVTGLLPDPQIVLHQTVNNADTQPGANDNWGTNATTLSAAFNKLGAFAPVSTTSKDAALLQALSGAVSAHVFDTANSGVVLTELYDAAPGGTAKLVNVSARNYVGTGDNILIAGFVVGTGAPKKLLIRGIGPTLNTLFGVTGILADPKLDLYDAKGNVIYRNDDWGTGDVDTLRTAMSKVGAFPLADSTSKDAVLLVTLPAGVYTAMVSGANSTTGEALVEIYEVP